MGAGEFRRRGCDPRRLAGAFGSHIDVKYAALLGMLPPCEPDQVSSAGNAAGTGAIVALLDAGARGAIEARVRGVEKVETAVEEAFQEHFVQAMAFPSQLGEAADAPLRRRRRRRT